MGQENRSGMVGLTAIEISPEHNWEHPLKGIADAASAK